MVDESAAVEHPEDALTPEERRKPSGGWGSMQQVASILRKQGVLLSGPAVLRKQNKKDGFACVSCAWAKPAHPSVAEFCENGAKATAWEITSKRAAADFFARHTLAELRTWDDLSLEDAGRLTVPMRWDPATDRYLEVSWQDAFDEIGSELRKLGPASVVFYASGRASLETSYLYQLLARLYGTNNLPDSSNMCHESTSVALPTTIGVPIGTVRLDDFAHTDAIFFFGQNVGTNSPRMLHQLQEARRRGIEIVTFNPLRERGLASFVNPQSPTEMLTNHATAISTQYHQLRNGGDTAVLTGLCKRVIEADDLALAAGTARVLDVDFIAEHTHGFDAFVASVRAIGWDEIERESALTRAAIEAAADVYVKAGAVIAVYGMGLTQHREGVLNVQMLSNLLLLRGNIGRLGAGICPVRGHSNVQGQRTVGITEKPELAPLDKLAELYGFEPPRTKGLNTVEACEGLIDGSVRAFIGLGGNFVRAVPDTVRVERAWSTQRLTVQIATKLNRSHLVHGEISYVLPCLGRIEVDSQGGVEQTVTIEDSTGCMHPSRGQTKPAADTLLSETAIVVGIAEATLPANPKVPWRTWANHYGAIRDAIALTFPEIFHDFNARLDTPGGIPRPIAARMRQWKTPNGKANFIVPAHLASDPDMADDDSVLRLLTIRSDDQFNTTVYGLDDRFRGVEGTRRVLLMCREDVDRLRLADGDAIRATTVSDDGITRVVDDLRVKVYDIPRGCVAGYYPECNPLIPLWHHAKESKVPAAKAIPIRLTKVVDAAPPSKGSH